MKKSLLLLIIAFVISLSAIAQNSTSDNFLGGWVIAGGNTSDDITSAITTDEDGNIYVTGYFEDTIDFDPGPGKKELASAGGSDMFVAKYSSTGELIWAERIGGANDDHGADVTVDKNNVYVAGYFYEGDPIKVGDSIYTSAGGWDMLVIKMSLINGNIIWSNHYGTAGTDPNTQDMANGIAVDDSSNIYITGCIGSTINGSNGTVISFDNIKVTVNGQLDMFIAKLGQDGIAKWVRPIGNATNSVGLRIKARDGFVYTTGAFQGTNVDFNRDSLPIYNLTASETDLFIAKHDTSGNLKWAKSAGGDTNDDIGRDISVDKNGNVFVTGSFSGTNVDFGNSLSLTSSGIDAFVMKLFGNGTTQWVKKYSGSGSEQGYGVASSNTGDIFVSGIYNSSNVDFGNSYIFSTKGSWDVYIAKLDENGNPEGVKSIGGKGADFNTGAALSDSNMFASGSFEDTVDFNPGIDTVYIGSKGASDFYVLNYNGATKKEQTITFEALEPKMVNDGDFDPNATSSLGLEVYYSSSDTSVATIAGKVVRIKSIGKTTIKAFQPGNDTVFAADAVGQLLTINNLSNITLSECDSFNFYGRILKETNTYYDTILNSAGTDSIIILTLTIKLSNAVTITPSECRTYTSPSGKIWTTSGNYTDTIPNAAGCHTFITINLTITTPEITGDLDCSGKIERPDEVAGDINFDGTIGEGEIAGDINGNGTIDKDEITGDTNGNGEIGDGEIENDANGNGVLDGDEISEIDINNMFGTRVYPIPVNNTLNIDFQEIFSNTKICITNIMGTIIYDNNNSNIDKLEIDMSSYAPGIYIVNIQTDSYSSSMIILKP